MDACYQLESSEVSVGIGIFITIAMFISYLPQYYKIIANDSVEGINIYTLFIGNTANYYNFLGTLTLSTWKFACCHLISSVACGSNVMPTIQMCMPWFSITIYIIIFLKYKFKYNTYIETQQEKIFILLWAFIFIVPVTVAYICLISKNVKPTNDKEILGNFLNISSAVLCLIQWFPQILTTYKKKSLGSLSYITLIFQSMGSIIIFCYQTFFTTEELSVGAPFLVSGLLQLLIVSMGLYYKIKTRREYEIINDSDL